MIDHAQKPEYREFAEKVLEAPVDPATSVWITKLHADGSIAAVVVFRNFAGGNCEVLLASDGKARWASKEFLAVCCRYAFNQMKLKRVTSIIELENKHSIRFCHKMGHTIEGILRSWFDGKDAVIMRMLPEECKWLGVNHG